MKKVFSRGLYLIVGLLALVNHISLAQVYMQDVDGKPIRIGQYVDIEGTPYLQDTWSAGAVKLSNGDEIKNIELKYDLAADNLLFKNKQGEALEFVQPVGEFTIAYSNKGATENKHFKSGYPAHDGLSERTFYEVIFEGEKATLLKKATKVIREEKGYSTATITKAFFPNEAYYLYKEGNFVKIKKDQKAVIAALGDKADKIRSFVSSNKLNLKEDKDLTKIMEYYNSL